MSNLPDIVVVAEGAPGEPVAAFATIVDPDTKSGNPHHEVGTGEFGEGGRPKPTAGGGPLQGPEAPTVAPSRVPPGFDPESWARRMDAIRDVARALDPGDNETVQRFFAERLQREVTPEELQSFLIDIQHQQLDDLADVLDQELRSSLPTITRKYKSVRVKPPRGWNERMLAGLDANQIASLATRLVARGHDQSDIDDLLGER